jgi:mono/diheme cytochrome c family protein
MIIRNIFKLVCICMIFALIPILLFAHDWKAPKEAAERKNPVPKDAAAVERGQLLFEQFCANCHGKSGQGDGPVAAALNPRPANLAERAGHHSDGDFAWKIASGRGSMPAFKNQLTENQIWDLAHFIQSLKNP